MTRPIVLATLAGAIGFVCGVIAALLYEADEPEMLPTVFPSDHDWNGWEWST